MDFNTAQGVYQNIGKEFIEFYPTKISFAYLSAILFFLNTWRLLTNRKIFSNIELLYEVFLIFILMPELYFSGIVADEYIGMYANYFLILVGLCIAQFVLHLYLLSKDNGERKF